MSNDIKIGYYHEPQGLYWYPPPPDTEEGEEQKQQAGIWLSSNMLISAMVRDDDDFWGRLLSYYDYNGDEKQWVIPGRLMAKPVDLWSALYDRGINIAAGKLPRTLLYQYLTEQNPEGRARVVSRLGWFQDHGMCAYVLPDVVYGDTNGERIIFLPRENSYQVKGTLDQWIENVGKLCVGNSRLTMSVCVPLASSLLELADEESGGIHLFGQSREFKTGCAEVSASTAGRPKDIIKTWRSTDNGLEATLEARSDGAYMLDEMGQADANHAGQSAYMIANGVGKTRMSATVEARKSKRWNVFFLSTGEITLADKMGENHKKPRAGQQVRLLDVPSNAGCSMGVFEDIHGAASPGEFAEQLRRAAKQYHGNVFRMFVEKIATAYANNQAELRSELRQDRAKFISDHLPEGANGQVRTGCARFSLLAIAGEIATQFGLTGWPQGEATRAAVTCFKAWLDNRGSIGDADLEAGIRQVLAFIDKHGASRFEDMTPSDAPTGNQVVYNRAGFRRRHCPILLWQYYVLPSAWRDELCKGYPADSIAKEMINRGLLIHQPNRLTKAVRGMGRVYVLAEHATTPDDRTKEERHRDFMDDLTSTDNVPSGYKSPFE